MSQNQSTENLNDRIYIYIIIKISSNGSIRKLLTKVFLGAGFGATRGGTTKFTKVTSVHTVQIHRGRSNGNAISCAF